MKKKSRVEGLMGDWVNKKNVKLEEKERGEMRYL